MSYQETSSQLCTDRQIYIKTFQLAFQHLLICPLQLCSRFSLKKCFTYNKQYSISIYFYCNQHISFGLISYPHQQQNSILSVYFGCLDESYQCILGVQRSCMDTPTHLDTLIITGSEETHPRASSLLIIVPYNESYLPWVLQKSLLITITVFMSQSCYSDFNTVMDASPTNHNISHM